MTPKNELFDTLESILSAAKDIDVMTQNQETIILYGAEAEILTELLSNKQEKILELDELETKFQSIYEENKEMMTESQDVERLQGLVSQVMKTKANITKGEEQNRRLWVGKGAPEVKEQLDMQPKSYVASQYKKYSKL